MSFAFGFISDISLTLNLEILCSLWRILIALAQTFRSVTDTECIFVKHLNLPFSIWLSIYTSIIHLKDN